MNPRLIADLKRKMNRPLDELPKPKGPEVAGKFKLGEIVTYVRNRGKGRHEKRYAAAVLSKPKPRSNGHATYNVHKVAVLPDGPGGRLYWIRYVSEDSLERRRLRLTVDVGGFE